METAPPKGREEIEMDREEMEFEEKADAWEVRLAGAFNPALSARLYEELIAIVESPKDVVVDWSRAGRLDMAAFQVLLSFQQETTRRGRRFRVTAPSADLEKWLVIGGFDKLFQRVEQAAA